MATTARRLPRDERRAHLLDVAAELVVDGGYEAVTMEGVAARAGVSKGLGYAYFDNRDELLAELFDREMATLDGSIQDAVGEAVARGGAFEDRVRAVITAAIETVAHRGILIGALLRGTTADGPLEDRRRRRERNVERFFAEMIIEEFRVDEGQAVRAVAFLLGAYSGALDLWAHRRAHRADIIDTYVRMAVGGLRAMSAPQ